MLIFNRSTPVGKISVGKLLRLLYRFSYQVYEDPEYEKRYKVNEDECYVEIEPDRYTVFVWLGNKYTSFYLKKDSYVELNFTCTVI